MAQKPQIEQALTKYPNEIEANSNKTGKKKIKKNKSKLKLILKIINQIT